MEEVGPEILSFCSIQLISLATTLPKMQLDQGQCVALWRLKSAVLTDVNFTSSTDEEQATQVVLLTLHRQTFIIFKPTSSDIP